MISEVAMAGPLEEADSAFNGGDFGLGRNGYSELANQGDRIAQFKLGVLYDEGNGVDKNSREAIRWYCVSSAQGFPEAAYIAIRGSLRPTSSRVTAQSFQRARQWYLIAAGQGETKAAVNLVCREPGIESMADRKSRATEGGSKRR